MDKEEFEALMRMFGNAFGNNEERGVLNQSKYSIWTDILKNPKDNSFGFKVKMNINTHDEGSVEFPVSRN
jgi:hypothetical protein